MSTSFYRQCGEMYTNWQKSLIKYRTVHRGTYIPRWIMTHSGWIGLNMWGEFGILGPLKTYTVAFKSVKSCCWSAEEYRQSFRATNLLFRKLISTRTFESRIKMRAIYKYNWRKLAIGKLEIFGHISSVANENLPEHMWDLFGGWLKVGIIGGIWKFFEAYGPIWGGLSRSIWEFSGIYRPVANCGEQDWSFFQYFYKSQI